MQQTTAMTGNKKPDPEIFVSNRDTYWLRWVLCQASNGNKTHLFLPDRSADDLEYDSH